MLIERRIERHQLPYYLQVFNRYTDKPMGCLGNVSEQGLMLISELPVLVGADFQLRLKVPDGKNGVKIIDINASCLWCQEDETPGIFDSGFRLQAAPIEYHQLIQALKRYFSFHSLEASA
ncbi:PilZ domain-containing protein [Pseudomonas huanghezhanensis]|uniref:PilZ domain-containing protein n=1 Tax=Pseudomonas huanghezhanensis TaxID=3002903 RepID=UPI00228597E2|nr:PilZ domain-containing protein [Pseudomonas sp. BSw22131]